VTAAGELGGKPSRGGVDTPAIPPAGFHVSSRNVISRAPSPMITAMTATNDNQPYHWTTGSGLPWTGVLWNALRIER
jgi:hypothetical protein